MIPYIVRGHYPNWIVPGRILGLRAAKIRAKRHRRDGCPYVTVNTERTGRVVLTYGKA